MSDRLESLINSAPGKAILGALGVNPPPELHRYAADQATAPLKVDLGGQASSPLYQAVESLLEDLSATRMDATSGRCDALIFDASQIATPEQLDETYRFFHARIRQLGANGRIVILGRPHMACQNLPAATAQRALEGLSRSLGKEVGRKGSTAQLVTVAEGAESKTDSTLRFLLSAKSAYISGQVLRVANTSAEQPENLDWQRPLAGKTALVTGASRGIGAAIAAVLSRDGAQVLGVDIAPMETELRTTMEGIGGTSLVADITAEDTPQRLSELFAAQGGVDIVVHNAGVTRDKTLANMTEDQWQMVLNINLAAAQRITDALLSSGALNDGGSIVGVSSMNGIAGQRGQTNYAASKAGVIGYVDYMTADEALRQRGITVNAVAPGFIETAMTAAIPFMTRQFGRRLNSLSQGGLPVDVAEAIAYFANPASRAVQGNVMRVCGQALIGA